MAEDHLSHLRHHQTLHPLLGLHPHIVQPIPLQHRRHHLHRPHRPLPHLVTKIGEPKDFQAHMEGVLVGVAVVEAIDVELQA